MALHVQPGELPMMKLSLKFRPCGQVHFSARALSSFIFHSESGSQPVL